MTDSRTWAMDDEPDAFPLKVLVVDDHPINHQVMAAILPHFGCRATAAMSGEEAIALAGVAVFDLIVMDHYLPGIQGEEATQRIRAETPSAHALIVRWTSDSGSRLNKALYDQELAKPVRWSALADTVREARRLAVNRADGAVGEARRAAGAGSGR